MVQIGTLLNLSILPTDLSNLALWVDADNIVNVSGKASQILDLSGNNKNSNVATESLRPSITSSSSSRQLQRKD